MLKQLILHIKIDTDFVKQLLAKRSQTFFLLLISCKSLICLFMQINQGHF
ncbi:hypothetical protein NBO_19g0013 [Nosema bombycis CQ1]|uniref:Uncharacterized protein n=1 Tax=Nosema bombycis (strain CQ1 / CVCC 102059) TaxID=578461 RepID=R0MK91_NOSB1|nr:hypothetical protein NBO_19g0013 [Nosema bombycis CQ1]|eukprot:EOB14660.1 hypothetical protein NBO_19g0013 [Nosema bombycis CQ1]